jgi:putative spermidine/putrescine transport system permease protein
MKEQLSSSYPFIGFVRTGFALLVAVFLLMPLLAMMPLSFTSGSFMTYPIEEFSLRWYVAIMEPRWIDALHNSLIIGIFTTAISTVLGTLAAYGFARGGMPAANTLLGFLLAPMIVPPVITGLGMYLMFSQFGLSASYAGLIIAHSIIATPFVLVTVSASLQSFDFNLLRAAGSLGASPIRSFLEVLLPLAAPGILTGALFAFFTSFDEVVVTIFLAGPSQKTLPLKMFEGIRDNIDPSILAAATFLIVIAVLTLAAGALLTRLAIRRRSFP